MFRNFTVFLDYLNNSDIISLFSIVTIQVTNVNSHCRTNYTDCSFYGNCIIIII